MAELLNKSLDEIIKESRTERKGGRNGSGGRNKNGNGKGNNNNKIAFKAKKPQMKNVIRDNRQQIKKPFQNNDITSRLGGKESDFDKG